MEKTEVGARIHALRRHYNLGVKEFATRCSLSHVAIFQMENGRTLKPHRSTMTRIAKAFGSNADWLLHGKGEMLPHGGVQLEDCGEDHWKEEAYQALKSRNVLLELEVERLWTLVNRYSRE